MLKVVNDAIASQLEAIRHVQTLVNAGLRGIAAQKLLKYTSSSNLLVSQLPSWQWDHRILSEAVPFAWETDTILAVMSIAQSIPDDAVFNEWNLSDGRLWWYFDHPLPYPTNDLRMAQLPWGTVLDNLTLRQHPDVRAICLGWDVDRTTKVYRVSVWTDNDPALVNEHEGFGAMHVLPSQTWSWIAGETLRDMLTRCEREHDELYIRGKFSNSGIDVFPKDKFLDAADKISRFILAGMVWMNQKVVAVTEEPVERHARKRYNRVVSAPLDRMKVVNLRRMETPDQETTEPSGERREYSCRFPVDGFMRNQACGPKFSQRRLTYVHPFIKGPDDKPLRIPKSKVYVVNR